MKALELKKVQTLCCDGGLRFATERSGYLGRQCEGTIPGGTRLERIYEGNGWSVVKTGGGEYYVSSSYVKKADGSRIRQILRARTRRKIRRNPRLRQKRALAARADLPAQREERLQLYRRLAWTEACPMPDFQKSTAERLCCIRARRRTGKIRPLQSMQVTAQAEAAV